jgi:serine/threonine protein kinase
MLVLLLLVAVVLLLLLPGELLGQGGFADVHAAQLVDPLLGFKQQVAVKRLRPDVLKSPADLREFLTEANLLRKLAHRCAQRRESYRWAPATPVLNLITAMNVPDLLVLWIELAMQYWM